MRDRPLGLWPDDCANATTKLYEDTRQIAPNHRFRTGLISASIKSRAASILIAFRFERLVAVAMVSHALFIVCNGLVAMTSNFPELAQAVVKVRDGWVLGLRAKYALVAPKGTFV